MTKTAPYTAPYTVVAACKNTNGRQLYEVVPIDSIRLVSFGDVNNYDGVDALAYRGRLWKNGSRVIKMAVSVRLASPKYRRPGGRHEVCIDETFRREIRNILCEEFAFCADIPCSAWKGLELDADYGPNTVDYEVYLVGHRNIDAFYRFFQKHGRGRKRKDLKLDTSYISTYALPR